MTQERQTSSVDDHLRFPWRDQRLADGRRCCAWPDCDREALFRAPKSRTELRAFVWFCLDHVREYNKAWNYFLGMSQEEIDAYRRDDVTWHRPTWRFGTKGEREQPRWYDPFGFMGDQEETRPPPRASEPEDVPARMRGLLELEPSFTLQELRTAYKAMAKRYHPDLHAGNKEFEERLKLVIEAYRYLKDNELYLEA